MAASTPLFFKKKEKGTTGDGCLLNENAAFFKKPLSRQTAQQI
jgi:hypothetical protein